MWRAILTCLDDIICPPVTASRHSSCLSGRKARWSLELPFSGRGGHSEHGVLWAELFTSFLLGEGLSSKAGCDAMGRLSSAPGPRQCIFQPLGPSLERARRTP